MPACAAVSPFPPAESRELFLTWRIARCSACLQHRNAIEMGTPLQHLHFPLLCTLLSSPNLYSPTECHRINLLCALIQAFAVADGTTVEQLHSLQELMHTACRMEFVALDDLKALAAHYNRPSITGSVICLPLGPADTPSIASQDSPTSITAATLSATPESAATLRSFRFAGEVRSKRYPYVESLSAVTRHARFVPWSPAVH